jgi:hypothetical protein
VRVADSTATDCQQTCCIKPSCSDWSKNPSSSCDPGWSKDHSASLFCGAKHLCACACCRLRCRYDDSRCCCCCCRRRTHAYHVCIIFAVCVCRWNSWLLQANVLQEEVRRANLHMSNGVGQSRSERWEGLFSCTGSADVLQQDVRGLRYEHLSRGHSWARGGRWAPLSAGHLQRHRRSNGFGDLSAD